MNKFFYFIAVAGIVAALFVGIFVINPGGDNIKNSLVRYALIPGFVFVFTYAVILVLPWVSKQLIGLVLPKMSGMVWRVPDVSFFGKLLYVLNGVFGSILAGLCGYIVTIFFVLNIKQILIKGGL